MDIRIAEKDSNKAAVAAGEGMVFTDVQGALDFMTQIRYDTGCSCAVIPKASVPADFFDLKTGLAGEILQKFTNYGFRIAFVGDFENIKSKSLRDFIYESNRAKKYLFVASEKEALDIYLD
jgi:hypothetical protein